MTSFEAPILPLLVQARLRLEELLMMVTFWTFNRLSAPETRNRVSKKVRVHLLNKSTERKHWFILCFTFF